MKTYCLRSNQLKCRYLNCVHKLPTLWFCRLLICAYRQGGSQQSKKPAKSWQQADLLFNSEDKGSMFLKDMRFLLVNMIFHSRRPNSTQSLLQEPQVQYMQWLFLSELSSVWVTMDEIWVGNQMLDTYSSQLQVTTVHGSTQSKIHYVFSVCCVFLSPLVTASSGGWVPSSGFLNCSCVSATTILS
jgi:hypothetical protein